MGAVSQRATNKEFWNKKARTFPRYEEGEDNYEAGVLNTIRQHGVDFQGKSVLDVGCGSGMYTIRIAKEARRVTAVDISSEMLRILQEDAMAQGLGNIDYVRAEWMEFPDGDTYDIVFCSMTPAIQGEESRLKLLSHAGRWTVFMGFAGLMRSNVMTGLYEHYGVTPRVFNNGTEMRLWLDDRGIRHARCPVEGEWVVPKSLEETMDSCTGFLSQYSVTPDQGHLREYLSRFETEPGVCVERTEYKIELLIWEK